MIGGACSKSAEKIEVAASVARDLPSWPTEFVPVVPVYSSTTSFPEIAGRERKARLTNADRLAGARRWYEARRWELANPGADLQTQPEESP